MVPEISVTVLEFNAFFCVRRSELEDRLEAFADFCRVEFASSAARAAKPQAIILATIANPIKRRILLVPN